MTAALDVSDFTKEEIKSILAEIKHPIDIAVFDSSNYFNLGASIRTAHNFLVRNIYAVDLNDFYPKASMSARRWETVIKMTSQEFFKTHSGRNMIGMERRPGLDSETLYTFSWPEEPLVLFGGEKCGLSDEYLSHCKHTVSVPVYGLLNDFNVGIAIGMTLYDWCNKYYAGGKALNPR
jgi:tRNA G18 (ribose-2'-O)-methylase SpoU